ncbi:hypothetical protein CIB48_g1025 [Xylaria polymorpha]|nr:hypothetical protein CIB48_g1025 [Xylaria polymorpha]
MSASPFGFTWARRSPSLSSHPDEGEFAHSSGQQPARPASGPADSRQLSSSFGSSNHREPTRSFIPGSVQDHISPLDSAGFARSVREDTAQLASYILADKGDKQNASFLAQRSSNSSPLSYDCIPNDDTQYSHTDRIEEVSEPPSPDSETDDAEDVDHSTYNNRLRSPRSMSTMSLNTESAEPSRGASEGASEATPLLGPKSHRSRSPVDLEDLENQKPQERRCGRTSIREAARKRMRGLGVVMNPKTWDKKAIWDKAIISPLHCLPAVIVGLLLNILDALSYGPAGISIFYIEVVPFFHSMAATITTVVGEDKPDAVIATTITSFAISSMLTGLVFYLMGRFKLGYIIGFIPRHILIGCIGGVGWFLVVTGFEVSARLGEFHYDLETARRLFKTDTLPLWLIPLALAILLFGLQRKLTSRYVLPAYILSIPFVFYFVVLSLDSLSPEHLRQTGWIFEAPEAGQPWWYFWTLYKFELVHWGAIIDTLGAMFALTFFSLLHVPINVPALAQNAGEDNLKLDHELKLHGVSNFVSGLIVVIVLTMGIYDFVVGIFVGIILAFVSAIFHASQVSAIRATYTGDQVGSMVRRNPSQHHYLHEVGTQTYIIKLSGFLFFGTIVGVEEKIRQLISDDAFKKRPISYMILDLRHVTGIDFSAAEGFKTISRLLHGKGVHLLVSGKDAGSSVGLDLRAVGLGSDDIDVKFMPDLNSALESCENEQLKTFYANQEALRVTRPSPSKNLDVPKNSSSAQAFDFLSQSPRRHHLHEAARNVLTQQEVRRTTRWQSISEPLRLMLQVFHNVSQKNEDFWFRSKPYFSRKEFSAGTVLYHRGEEANGFYLLERGELHAEYETPQGHLSEPIVQGTTCGELPFFSETSRTATVRAVKDSVVWVMDTDSWNRLQDEENDVAQELLRVSLKLTTERMNAMTNYIAAVGN